MVWKVQTGPTQEPVTLPEAKAQCRVDIDDDDKLISSYIVSARRTAELIARRAFITQTIDLVMDEFPAEAELFLPCAPLQSVTHIKYTDSDGNESTFSSDSYIVDTYSEPGRVVLKTGESWPGTTLQAANGVVVRFVAGYGDDPADVPEVYRQAIQLLVGHWYENREEVVVGNVRESGLKQLPLGVRDLLRVDRVW